MRYGLLGYWDRWKRMRFDAIPRLSGEQKSSLDDSSRVTFTCQVYEQFHIAVRFISDPQSVLIVSLVMPHSLRPSLPDDVLYSKLLQVASEQGDRTIVDDRSRNTQFGYLDILNGIASLKQQLQDQLDASILERPGEFFVALLAPNGYEFIVGVLATLAIGGVVVPVRELFPSSRHQVSPKPQQLSLMKTTSDRSTTRRNLPHNPPLSSTNPPRRPRRTQPRLRYQRRSPHRLPSNPRPNLRPLIPPASNVVRARQTPRPPRRNPQHPLLHLGNDRPAQRRPPRPPCDKQVRPHLRDRSGRRNLPDPPGNILVDLLHQALPDVASRSPYRDPELRPQLRPDLGEVPAKGRHEDRSEPDVLVRHDGALQGPHRALGREGEVGIRGRFQALAGCLRYRGDAVRESEGVLEGVEGWEAAESSVRYYGDSGDCCCP